MTIPTVEQADRLAKSVYQHRLGLKPKENVVIEASPSTIKWAGGFVREARRRGARPLLQYEDETSYWTAIQEGHADRLGTPGEHEWAALDEADVYIFFFGPEHARRRAQLSEATLEKVTAYNGRWYERARKAGVRGVRMMLTRATSQNAQFWGVPLGAWRRELIAASMLDPASLAKDAATVRRAFERGRELRIRHPNGTDLRLALKGRPVHETLGAVTPAARKTRFGLMANVPDGTIYVAVDESSADGTLVSNLPTMFGGARPLREGRFRFRDGRLRSYRFRKGATAFRRSYESADTGKSRPAFIEVGLNPAVQRSPGLEEVVRGAVTAGVGGNAGFGGATKSNFFGFLTVAGAELRVDGRPVVRGGRIVRG